MSRTVVTMASGMPPTGSYGADVKIHSSIFLKKGSLFLLWPCSAEEFWRALLYRLARLAGASQHKKVLEEKRIV